MKRNPALGLVVLVVLVFGVSLATSASAGEIVIANPSIGVDHVDASTIKKVFLGKSTKIGDAKVTFGVLSEGATHEAFLEDFVSKTPSQFLSYWRKLAFTGKGSMPQEFASEEALVAYVASTAGAIGYVSEGTTTEGVTVLRID